MKNWYIVQSHSSFENKVAGLIKEEAEKLRKETAELKKQAEAAAEGEAKEEPTTVEEPVAKAAEEQTTEVAAE